MTPIKQGKYEFRPASLVQLRQRLKLKQKKMAELLSIPPNTLSRWENGASTPDAQSLAAIYSFAKEREVTAEFFQPRKSKSKARKQRNRVSTMWDLSSLALQSHQLEKADAWLTAQIRSRFGKPEYEWFKVFARPEQATLIRELTEHNWDVWEFGQRIDDELVSHAKSDCGQKPKETAFVLIANSGSYSDLINELSGKGVDVHIITPSSGYSEVLVGSVAKKQWIKLPDDYIPTATMRTTYFSLPSFDDGFRVL